MTRHTTAWLTATAITLAVGALAAHADNSTQPSAAAQAARAELAAQARRDAGAARACEGQPFEWDGNVLVCHREANGGQP